MSEVLERPGRRATVLVSREELVLMEFDMEPETDGAGPHLHREHVDSFYVLEGDLEIMVTGETRHVKPGELVHAPPGVVHSFKNSSPHRLRLLNIHTPGMRFDEYIRKMDAGEDVDPQEYDAFEVEE
jgi:mannose-6-phosphate isomerase-like protein (cupin superfamily)